MMFNFNQLFGMPQITKETVFAAHEQEPRRRCFATHSGIQQSKSNGSKSFSVKFSESIKEIFEEDTGLELFHSQRFNNFYRMIQTDDELNKIVEWESSQGTRIFLRDCLSASIALDANLTDSELGQYTRIGALESNGKNKQDHSAIEQLANITAKTIEELPYYRDADLICAVPPRPDKIFDLPSIVTSLVSQKISKPDVTGSFVFNGQKSSVKSATFDEKWSVWENALVLFQNSPNFNIQGKKVILIDDKYQSGITIQYIAMKLQQAGAQKVYGLSFVKTLRDTDNA